MNLASIYFAICIASIGVTVVLGAPDWQTLVLMSALCIAIIGVPHGGLDHWTGRRLLVARFGSKWWIVFFPAYLAIAFAFAIAWYVVPVATVLLFFLLSAWHFGREDEKACECSIVQFTGSAMTESWTRALYHRCVGFLRSIAVGGLVIWIPSLCRSDEMRWLLSVIIPSSGTGDAEQVVEWTQRLSLVFVPVAGFVVGRDLLKLPSVAKNWVPLATVAIGIGTPILLSFTIYFCAWHSMQGLRRLRRQEELSHLSFAYATLPLSISAVAGTVIAGWLFHDATTAIANGEQFPVLQMLFIGLSAIAVPHVLLHELEETGGFLERIGNLEISTLLTESTRLQKGNAT
jgi:Brp/Blh family beta-carotene 15,15'-monooxygenase